MKYLLQVDFLFDGPFGEDMTNAMGDLAKDIANESGLIWKIWTENAEEKTAGGVYLFDNMDDTKRYQEKHTQRLEAFGLKDIRAKVFYINEELSAIDHFKA